MIRRWIIVTLLAAVLLVLALPAGLLYYAAYTQAGLNTVLSFVPRRIGTLRLAITGVRGTAATGIHVDRVEIEDERVHLIFAGIDGAVTLPPLLLQSLHVRSASIQSALIIVKPRTHPPRPFQIRFLPHWLEIQSDHLHILEATLLVPNGQQIQATELEGSGIVRARVIRIFDSALTMSAMRVTAHGVLTGGDPLGVDADARLSIRPSGEPPWVIDVSGRGRLNSLDFSTHFSEPLQADILAAHADLFSGQWHGEAHVTRFDLRAFGGGGALGAMSGRLGLAGEWTHFTARGPVSAAGLHAGEFEALFQGFYSDRVVTATHVELTHQASGAHAVGSGTIGVAAHGPRLDLAGSWKDFRWPLLGREAVVKSAAGQFTLQGLWPYALRASGDLAVRDLEPMPVSVVGTLSKERLSVSEGSVGALDGSVSVTSGELAWAPAPHWAAAGSVTDVNPQRFLPQLPGKVSFDFEVSGTRFDPSTDLALQVRDLRGRLRDSVARAAGKVVRHGPSWELTAVQAQLGHTTLALAGSIAERLDLRFDLQCQDLSLIAGASGRLAAKGSVHGTFNDPAIAADASGGELKYGGWSLGGLEAKLDFDARSTGSSFIDIHAHDLVHGARHIDAVNFVLQGAASDHSIDLALTTTGFKLAAEAQGGFANGVWRGELERLHVNGSDALHLDLEAPTQLLLSADAIHVPELCLAGSPARLCASGDRDRRHWSAALSSKDLPIKTLTAGLTPDVDYRGVLSIAAHAFAALDEPVQGTIAVRLADAQVLHRMAGGRVETTTLGSGEVDVNAGIDEVTANLGLEASSIGSIKGRLVAERSTDAWRDMPLSGEVSAQTAELDFLTLYLPQIDRAAGRVSTDLTVSGTVGSPLVSGSLKLTDGALDLYQINLAMRGATLSAQLTDNGVDFDGGAKIGAGSAAAHGHLEWHGGQPHGKFTLTGENLRVADVPEAQLDASPNLEFAIDGQNIAVTGAVKVPSAKIVPKDLTNAVRASSDETIVGRSETSPAARFKVVSDITLTLGDKVSIETSGVKGRLTGTVTVHSGEEEITRAAGELNIEGGEYAAYGRRLDIEKGRLIFNNSPVSNPGIDIRAIKRFEDTVAGINVRGTLLQPRMTFFSEPPLPQQQIVSLILAGGSLTGPQVASTTTTQRAGANTELLAQGGAILAQQLGAKFGIADVGVESDLNNETSVVLGKYLSPRLYISYGISLTQSLETVKVRYSLGDHWTIRTEFGQVGAADLVYTIDK